MFADADSEVNVGSIQTLVVSPPLAIVKVYDRSEYTPAVRPARRDPIRQCVDLVDSSIIGYKIRNLQQLYAVPIDSIKSKCLSSVGVIFHLPNIYEHH